MVALDGTRAALGAVFTNPVAFQLGGAFEFDLSGDGVSWADEGFGKAGTGGVRPFLQGTGLLAPGAAGELRLTDALPGATTNIIVGVQLLEAFGLFGGWLVPSADLIVFGLPVDGAGEHLSSFTWPVGVPAGFPVWVQHWVEDPGATQGYAASNGVLGVAHP